MKSQVDILCRSAFPALKEVWERLYVGKDMTYFQSYSWNELLLSCMPKDTRYYEVSFAVVKSKGQIRLIAPLWVIKKQYRLINQPQMTLLGSVGWSDYCNFIYDEWKDEWAEVLFECIRAHYGVETFHFSNLKETTHLYSYIVSHFTIEKDTRGVCVALSVPQSVEEYLAMLSKHAKQNIRTAQNRLDRDGVQYTISFDDKRVDREQLWALRAVRAEKKLQEELTQIGTIRRIKRHIKERFLSIPMRPYNPVIDDKQAAFLTIKHGEELMAFFVYGKDEIRHEIVVMAAGIDEKYKFYSPGMVLWYAFIRNAITLSALAKIDFTRGNEEYKKKLGGAESYIHFIDIKL